ncbi:hypothetical protein CLOHYLEM_04977 [[Clostridium] hylemonae DSM 15053]|uniref:Uncharacterized protein n=1 Tax=[Clostridium] hylemonae DSM 15053 TaxID=553973 RepID=C0BYT8_9FIRM|nr:hypothetical protein CLOHYLEM_04977 [[Clostridium] hylemonae DSM 15053]
MFPLIFQHVGFRLFIQFYQNHTLPFLNQYSGPVTMIIQKLLPHPIHYQNSADRTLYRLRCVFFTYIL